MKIVVIGGGFAGVHMALELSKNHHFDIELIDKNNYNFFPPLIYQVATGFLEPASISYPFRKLFRNRPNVRYRMGELREILPANNKVVLSNGEVSYEVLIIATGAQTSYFGMENVRRNSLSMKTLDDAIEMRNRLLQQMERASVSTDPDEIRKRLTVVIAGGGPTGVELSGMFAEMRNGILRKEYPELVGKGSEIYVVDGGDALLKPMSVQSQKDTQRDLEKLGVKIWLHSRVADYIDDKVVLTDGRIIETKTLIWAAGVTAIKFPGLPAESYGRANRMLVNEYHKVAGTENIYAIGDTCLMLTDAEFPFGHPQLAQVAIQQGKNLAHNLNEWYDGRMQKAFKYHDRGSMAIIGRKKAVVDIPKPKVHFQGWIAWLAWLFIHLVSLITYRNRVKTLYSWMIAYFTKDQSLRMIIKPSVKTEEKVV